MACCRIVTFLNQSDDWRIRRGFAPALVHFLFVPEKVSRARGRDRGKDGDGFTRIEFLE